MTTIQAKEEPLIRRALAEVCVERMDLIFST